MLGLTSGWMRGRRHRAGGAAAAGGAALRLGVGERPGGAGPTEGTAAEAAERCLAILRRFCDDVADLVRMETADWMVDFGADGRGAPLRTQSAAWSARPDGPTAPRLAHPGARPNMPRQRPPENPR